MFFKVDNGELLMGRKLYDKNFPSGMMTEEKKHLYSYPKEGWYWFDTEEQARETLNCPAPEPVPEEWIGG